MRFITLILFLSLAFTTHAARRGDGQAETVVVTSNNAPATSELDEMKTEMTYLTGRLEVLERAQKGEGEAKILERLDKLEKQIEHLTSSLTKVQSDLPPPSPETIFKKAKTEYDNDNFDEASDLFATYLKAKGALKQAEEALYLRAESLFHTKAYKQAIIEYNQLIEKFRKTKYHSKALYKTALAFEYLGLTDDSHAFYKELVERFPKSSEAQSARKALQGDAKAPAKKSKKKRTTEKDQE